MSTFAKDFAELMNAYNVMRAKWVAEFGNADGFDAWFRKRLLG